MWKINQYKIIAGGEGGVQYGLTDKIFKLHFNLYRFVVHFMMPREREGNVKYFHKYALLRESKHLYGLISACFVIYCLNK